MPDVSTPESVASFFSASDVGPSHLAGPPAQWRRGPRARGLNGTRAAHANTRCAHNQNSRRRSRRSPRCCERHAARGLPTREGHRTLTLGGGRTMQRSVDRGIRARSTARWVVAAAALVVAAACGDKNFNTVSLIPAVITVSSASNGQTGTIGLPLAEPISVQVTDQAGNPVANVIVTWTVLTGGGSVATATSTTDGNGNASVIWTLGPNPGDNTLRASIATGASVTISATGVAA